jgi:hypothetical protein
MRFDHLLDGFEALQFPKKGERTHPDRQLVTAARASVEAAVIDDEFLADCLAFELTLIESNRPRRGLVPFFTMPDLGVRFAFGYWAPGNSAPAHEHTAWTITAVCRNELEVLTYNRDESYRTRELVPKNRFHAPAGKAGYIFEHCIHAPMNVSRDWSLSFHVTSPRDGERADAESEPLPALRTRPALPLPQHRHPYANVLAARHRNRCVHQLARIIAAMKERQASDLLDRCFALGCAKTQKFIQRTTSRQSSAPRPRAGLGRRDILVRAHEDLALSHASDGEVAVLRAETPRGSVEEFSIDDVARDAIAFVAHESMFEVGAIPGNLSDEERIAIAEMLEESGLFSRIRPGVAHPAVVRAGS